MATEFQLSNREMFYHYNLMILTLLWLKQAGQAAKVRKFVYQKDMSEYCRRRVMPSVFLGRHVAEAHSQILHFSKLELPYTCFTSVRGESGSNLILVVQVTSDDSLIKACAENPNQLLVYEMGETFGAYWGPLTETLMWPSREPAPSIYTLRAMDDYNAPKVAMTSEITTTAAPTTTPIPIPTEPKQEYIRVELPLVNVSGRFVSSVMGLTERSFDLDDTFDSFYDVFPRNNEKYETSMLPMVQFSIGHNTGGRRFGSEPRYDLEYDIEMVTPDKRLTVPYFTLKPTTARKTSQRKSHVNIRTYKKHNTFYTGIKKPEALNSKQTTDTTRFNSIKSCEEIGDILKEFNQSISEVNKNAMESLNITSILESISKTHHNYSAYLNPNLEKLNTMSPFNIKTSTKLNFGFFTKKLLPHFTYATRNIHQFLKSTKYLNFTNNYIVTTFKNSTNVGNISQSLKTTTTTTTQTSTESVKETMETNIPLAINTNSMDAAITVDNNSQSAVSVTKQSLSTEIYKLTTPIITTQAQTIKKTGLTTHNSIASSSKPLTGTMVDHESWENVVLAAPGMAELLNQTSSHRERDVADIVVNISHQEHASSSRKKRNIQPIPIEQARPHHKTTEESFRASQTPVFGISDMQDFAQMIELQDDELHDRVALRYLRQYVGPSLFNICEYSEPKIRHVYLFNSSRIVLAISNFTLERMTVMLTPARSLVGGNAKCSPTSLECQVFGTRVCIDQINACDGVPNCGAYDIYDEDRLTCGAAEGLQHNVYLAAITFLAVLLTMLYTVHYWLKRCVPKVSEAFFVYTDRAENILYLDSIMRSPYDTEDSKIIHGHLFRNVDSNYHEDEPKKKHENNFLKVWRCWLAFINCRYKRKESTSLGLEIGSHIFDEPSRLFSFTELELRKIGLKESVNVSVQTSDSIEMPRSRNDFLIQNALHQGRRSTTHDMQDFIDGRNQSNELNMIKFFKQTRSDSLQSTSFDIGHICKDSIDLELMNTEEKEIKSHAYDEHLVLRGYPVKKSSKLKTTLEVLSEKAGTSKHASKHLRFEEEITTIPSSDIEESEDSPQASDNAKVKIQKDKKRHHDTNRAEGDETAAASSLDFKRFWNTKGKKPKKKTHLVLH